MKRFKITDQIVEEEKQKYNLYFDNNFKCKIQVFDQKIEIPIHQCNQKVNQFTNLNLNVKFPILVSFKFEKNLNNGKANLDPQNKNTFPEEIDPQNKYIFSEEI